MQHSDIIKALGGAAHLARQIGDKPNTVFYWTRPGRGIPSDRWLQICQLPEAAALGITLKTLAEARRAA